jgi:hemerythrin-like domain-containing protein
MQRRSTSSQTRASGTRARNDDAISMLMEDHKKVQKLFRDFEKAHEADDSEACQQIVQRACAELEVHTTLEEELFYPAAREALGEDEELIDEAEVEHQSAKELIAQLGAMGPQDQKYAATFTVLAEYVKHHIKEEERELFPKLKKAKLDVDSLGEEMQAQKRVLTEERGLTDDAEAEEATR